MTPPEEGEVASVVTCPACGHESREEMPEDRCVVFYACPSCGAELRPEPGDCCVFCSHGSRPCPPRQQRDGDVAVDGQIGPGDGRGPLPRLDPETTTVRETMERIHGATEALPFRVPGQHFAAGLLFLLLGSAGLVWRSRAVAGGSFSDPGLLATTHLFTLGWIGTSIMGGLYQFLPVALGSGIRWERLTHLTFGLWTAGVAVFVVGLASMARGALLTGAVLLGTAILLFTVNLTATLPGAKRRGLTWWCVAGSTLFLLGAWLLGALLAVNLTGGILGGSRFAVLAIHVHVAAGGWVLLTMVGVAHHLMPMFLLSHGAGDRLGKAAAALLAAATTALLLTGHGLPVSALPYALGLMAVGAGAFLLQSLRHFLHRRRSRIDPGMRLVAGALGLLALALATGATALLSPGTDASLLTAYGVLLVPGGLGLFVAGHYYRILPSLTWLHRFGSVAAERQVPRVGELFDHRLAHLAGALFVAGVLALAGGALLGGGALSLAGAVAFAAGSLVEGLQMLHVARQRP